MLLFSVFSVQGNVCVVHTVTPLLRVLVLHCPLHVDPVLLNGACNTIYSGLGNVSIEACHRCFAAPHKYFNGIASYCSYVLWLTGSACVHAYSQDLHVTFSELCFGNA